MYYLCINRYFLHSGTIRLKETQRQMNVPSVCIHKGDEVKNIHVTVALFIVLFARLDAYLLLFCLNMPFSQFKNF